jgi:predicted acylesterase/phospholipase RssA
MVLAVVLGGGGSAGVAWEAGIVMGLRQAGIDVSSADLFVGTSAGSIVGSHVAFAADLSVLAARRPAGRGTGPAAGGLPAMNLAASNRPALSRSWPRWPRYSTPRWTQSRPAAGSAPLPARQQPETSRRTSRGSPPCCLTGRAGQRAGSW